jgi:hypothetical protein
MLAAKSWTQLHVAKHTADDAVHPTAAIHHVARSNKVLKEGGEVGGLQVQEVQGTGGV